MSAPESQTSADQALSSLMGAVGGNPEASRLESAPVAPPRDWKAVQAAIDDYLEGYELRLDEGCHTPTRFERFLLVDAVAGLMHDDEFIDALYSAVTAARAAPAAGDARDAERLDFLANHGAYVAWSKDRECCAVFLRDNEGNSGPMTKWGENWLTAREAIDAAIAAQQSSQGGK